MKTSKAFKRLPHSVFRRQPGKTLLSPEQFNAIGAYLFYQLRIVGKSEADMRERVTREGGEVFVGQLQYFRNYHSAVKGMISQLSTNMPTKEWKHCQELWEAVMKTADEAGEK